MLGKGSRGTAETELPVLFELTVGVDHSSALSTDLWSWTLVYSVLSWAVVWALEQVWACFYIYIYHRILDVRIYAYLQPLEITVK